MYKQPLIHPQIHNPHQLINCGIAGKHIGNCGFRQRPHSFLYRLLFYLPIAATIRYHFANLRADCEYLKNASSSAIAGVSAAIAARTLINLYIFVGQGLVENHRHFFRRRSIWLFAFVAGSSHQSLRDCAQQRRSDKEGSHTQIYQT
jgi:hypothetical protein